jgi:sporulation and spore germination protein/putative peptidoglycan binding protein
MLKRAALFVALIGLVAVAASSGAPVQSRVPVFFLQGEQLLRVTRPGSSIADAVRQLMAGPTSREAARQVRTYVPSGTSIRSVALDGKLVTVDVNRRFLTGHNAPSLLARLAQLVGTATGNEGSLQFQLLVQGNPVSGVFPGLPTGSPITFGYLQTPNAPLPPPEREKKLPADPKVRVVQKRLIALGYLPSGTAEGRLGPQTEEAILAFQKWERLDRTGVDDAGTDTRLQAAARPTPRIAMTTGKRAEVLFDRQVALLIEDNRVVNTIAVSTGKPSTPTQPGHFAASHGCVRQVPAIAQMTYNFADVGMPVDVLAR